MAEVLEKRYTYADYRDLDVDDNFLYELLDGELVKKSAPSPNHQRVLRNVNDLMWSYVKKHKLGEIFFSPIDVFLDDENVPQPDLVFVAEAQKTRITNDGIMGAPNLVVEVISPSSINRDRFDKLKLYKRYAVAEYWIIDPANQSVEVYAYVAAEKDYDLHAFAVLTGEVTSKQIAGLTLNVTAIFE